MKHALFTVEALHEHAMRAFNSKEPADHLAFFGAARWLLSDLEELYPDSDCILRDITSAREAIGSMLGLAHPAGHAPQQHYVFALADLTSIKDTLERIKKEIERSQNIS
ncbi:hypothetical protein [Chromobacterium haemolyticum]|uniref:hypothetical protein n=1 Tax=Chromobacterium haemolyticum TaxID=394935 RepID=UPI0017467966|nr:hypothetical protein [Chromobacterium haemolyticum]QOD84165.1 hypothetical protein IEZ30_06740 [Chromobacterium haemolyticum]